MTQIEDLEAGEASTHDSPCIENSVEVVEPPIPTSADINESPEPQEECRICLMNDEIAQLVKPCHCIGSGKFKYKLKKNIPTGLNCFFISLSKLIHSPFPSLSSSAFLTVQYAHLKCLKLWVHERRDLHCEICKFEYTEDLIPELQPVMDAAVEEHARRRLNRSSTLQENRIRGFMADPPQEDTCLCCPSGSWPRAICLIAVIGTLLGLLLFLGLTASSETWAAILLRILAFAIPTLIVLRGVAACWLSNRGPRRVDAREEIDVLRRRNTANNNNNNR